MFTSDERSRVREWVLALAQRDACVTGGAVTGSAACAAEDRWSDVDVAFGIQAGCDPQSLLASWTRLVQNELGLIHYFDLQAEPAIYRVFLLVNGLELDIGLWPASQFGATGAKFRLIFGSSVEKDAAAHTSVDHLVGLCWHHALHARVAIERAKPWEAEYYMSALRDHSLEIACLRLGQPAAYARGIDNLPHSVTKPLEAGLARSLDRKELQRALDSITHAFLNELAQTTPSLEPVLRRILEDR